jgi:hypothetical protein
MANTKYGLKPIFQAIFKPQSAIMFHHEPQSKGGLKGGLNEE